MFKNSIARGNITKTHIHTEGERKKGGKERARKRKGVRERAYGRQLLSSIVLKGYLNIIMETVGVNVWD